jgi:type VI secretion system protein ImpA
MGGVVLAGEEPEWREVRERCVALLGRTKDLRVAVYLARALARTNGLPGFADGLALAEGLVERYWEGLHPRLDPDDGNDPTMRVNIIAGLSDREQVVNALRGAPLANSRLAGRYSLRDFELANGTLSKPEGDAAVADMASIDAAFLDMDAAELQAVADGVAAAMQHLDGLDRALNAAVGAGSSADVSLLRSTLKSMNQLLATQLARRGLADGAAVEAGAPGAVATMGGAPAMSGPLQTREDVVRMLDQCIDWYSKYEPSSPVPLLLRRAKRLVSKNFLELVQDLSPGGLNELQTIAGLESE